MVEGHQVYLFGIAVETKAVYQRQAAAAELS